MQWANPGPPHTIILTTGTPYKVPLILGNLRFDTIYRNSSQAKSVHNSGQGTGPIEKGSDLQKCPARETPLPSQKLRFQAFLGLRSGANMSVLG